MHSDQREREEFSQRLRQSLAASGLDGNSPTQLANGFNRLHEGKPVSVFAARKWLHGESLPTQDKIRTLAKWLGIAPVWLRYGETEQVTGYRLEEPALTENEIELLRGFRRLNAGHRQAVREMILTLLRIERQK